MALVDRLEAAAKYHDGRVWLGDYNQNEADMRELLEEARKGILAGEVEADRLREIVDDLRALNAQIAFNATNT